uniref:Uncharacterized protein n=1 Tax=Avena sativa TaxID=4498 RepID=A0ACD5YK16_AVESA
MARTTTMYRQFVNLMMRDERSTLYSMRRLGITPHLFHESPADAAANKKKGILSTISSRSRLPRPDVNFALQPKMADTTPMHFFSLLRGQGDGCVLFTAPFGLTTVYDVAMQSVITMPQADFSKPSDSIALSMTTPRDHITPGVRFHEHYQLYVMGRGEGSASFEVFNYGRAGFPTVGGERWWSWNRLPPPPWADDPDLHDSRRCPSAAAVLDETTICMSCADGGAYTFDTAKCEWSRAGSWVLPIHGAAEYVPELGLWFGLEATERGNHHHHRRLCAFDLSSSSWPPVVLHAWDYLDDDLPLPDDWLPEKWHLVNLGSGRFCIATSFRAHVTESIVVYGFSSDEEQVENEYSEATLLTGVDVVRCGSGALQMIKHKSLLYDIEDIRIHCVL